MTQQRHTEPQDLFQFCSELLDDQSDPAASNEQRHIQSKNLPQLCRERIITKKLPYHPVKTPIVKGKAMFLNEN
jgi:hypothetical protein